MANKKDKTSTVKQHVRGTPGKYKKDKTNSIKYHVR